jgi:TP901 family phage tail tape measure protein
MAKIELNIVALGDFSAVNAQIKALQVQVDLLNKGVAGVGLGSTLAKDLAGAQAAFKATMLSTGQFTAQTVKMASETEKFGAALTSGKLKLSEYFNIITGKAGQATASMNALAESQIRLQNSVVVKNKNGFLDVYTPTSFNAVAQAEELVTMKAMMMQKAIDGGSMALINFGKNTQWAGRQLTVGLTMPMVMFGASAVKSFKETNIELTRLQRLYGEGLTPPSQAQIDKISNQVLKLGTTIAQTMGIAQTETVKAAANFAAMGREGQNLIDTTTQTMRLSKLGAVSTADATNTIVALQSVYKVSTNDLATAVNFLSDIQKQTTMTLNDMTQAIPRVGPIMQQLGGTYKDTAVMLVAMRESGIPAAQAANAIKSAMASIIAPTSSATKEFAKFGINLESIKNAGGPVQMIEQLQAGLSKLSPLVREQLIEKLFGKFQFARVSALIENFGKAGSQTVNALKIAGATSSQLATLANQEMKQATGSVSAKWTRSLEGFKATLYPIGQKFVEMGTMILDVANKIGHAFSKLPSPLKGFFGFLAIGAALAGPLIMLTGLLSNFAGYLLKGVGLIMKLANGGMSLKQLLTPEIIASQKAAELFSNQIVNDVDAVDLLNQAVARLTTSLAEMSGAMVTGTSDIATKTAAVTAAASINASSLTYT